jgi:hypothetical protein
LGRITDLLLEHEGVDPTNERARALAWVFVHRPEMYVAGAPAQAPHYRFVCQIPEGQYNDERRAAVTQAVVEVEDQPQPSDVTAQTKATLTVTGICIERHSTAARDERRASRPRTGAFAVADGSGRV